MIPAGGDQSHGFPNSQRGEKGALAAPHRPGSSPANRLAWSWTLTQNFPYKPWDAVSWMQTVPEESKLRMGWERDFSSNVEEGLWTLSGKQHCLLILLKNRINTSKRWHPPPQGTAVWGVRLSPCWLYRPSVGTHCNHSGLMGAPRQPWAIREDATDLSSCRSHYLNSPYSSNSLGKASHHRATWGSQRREKA